MKSDAGTIEVTPIIKYDVVIVGAGHGGAQVAISLRQQKFEGTIAIVGEEPEFPYERPPLSKEYFAGEKTFARILIRPEQFWRDRQIDMLLGERVDQVNPAKHEITTSKGSVIQYGRLVWATGGHPRKLDLPGSHLVGVQGLRTKADADEMIQTASTASQIVIVGGGYIGLEAAAVLAIAGKKVIVLEVFSRVLARVAGEDLSRFYEQEHRSRGVDVKLEVVVSAFEGSTHVSGVRLSTGEILQADLVIVGIGIIPAITPLVEAGARSSNGVEVDDYCRTSLEDIYAVGDCAAHRNVFADNAMIRLESVQNANDMAQTVARDICGISKPYEAAPWFWSNQFDLKLQTVGLSAGFDQTVLRGNLSERSFSIAYLKAGKVIAFDCINAVKDYVQGKALVLERAHVDPARLANASLPLKEIWTKS